MLKKKFGMIVLVLITVFALVSPVAIAAETDTNAEVTTTNEEVTTTEENFKQGDVYLTGDDITIDYIVDGNLFIFADTVNINSQIGGDAFIFANSVTVGDQGYIFSNLFTIAPTLNILGVVYDLYALSDNVTITGYVYRDIRVSANNLNIY